MKIYIGNINISSLYDDLRAGFEALGHSVVTVEDHGAAITSAADNNLRQLIQEKIDIFKRKFPHVDKTVHQEYADSITQKIYKAAFSEACNADLAIFIWNSFLPDWADIPILKQHNTKTVICFAGSEARVLPLENIFRRISGAPPAISIGHDMETALRFVRLGEYHADAIMGGALAGLRPSYISFTTILDVASIPHHITDRDVPVVMHAPSSRQSKGTEVWMRIFYELQAEGYKFNVRLLENVAHNEILNSLKNVDIFCDGLIHGGKMAREAMAAGCAVLSCFGDNFKATQDFFLQDDDIIRKHWNVQPGSPEDVLIQEEHLKKTWYFYPEINPCVPVCAETAKDRLRELLRDKEKRMALARRGRPVVEKYGNPAMVCQDIIQCAFEPDSFKTAAVQSFHRPILYYEFVPNNPEEAAACNRTTDIVRECDWYKRAYKPVYRDGLLF